MNPPAQRLYPVAPAGLAGALADRPPVLLDGLLVQFDEEVALQPADLAPPTRRPRRSAP